MNNLTVGGEVDGTLDVLVDLIAALQVAESTPSHVIVDPLGWTEFRKFKVATDWNQSLIGAAVSDAQQLLLSLPVLVSRAMTAYTRVVVDRSAVVSAYGAVVIATWLDRYFDSDSVAIRATWRIGQNVVRPERCGTFTIAGGGS